MKRIILSAMLLLSSYCLTAMVEGKKPDPIVCLFSKGAQLEATDKFYLMKKTLFKVMTKQMQKSTGLFDVGFITFQDVLADETLKIESNKSVRAALKNKLLKAKEELDASHNYASKWKQAYKEMVNGAQATPFTGSLQECRKNALEGLEKENADLQAVLAAHLAFTLFALADNERKIENLANAQTISTPATP